MDQNLGGTFAAIVYDASQPPTTWMELEKAVGLRFLSNKRIDASVGAITIDGARAKTIDRELVWQLVNQWQYVGAYSDGAYWLVRNHA